MKTNTGSHSSRFLVWKCLQLVHVSGFEGMTAYDLWETHGNRSRRIYIEGCAISYSFFVIVFPFILFYAESIPGG
jgi:hypothetical protein